ncbi:MAG: hypothetical protein INH37_00500 [Myxococcaceae bacterium]|nr:hypothetical protein [Myxococcaceae bacterium]
MTPTTIKFGDVEPPLTVEAAAADERIRAAYRHFCAHQAEEAAEAETLLVVLKLLPPFGPRRSWHVNQLGPHVLGRRADGTWFMK